MRTERRQVLCFLSGLSLIFGLSPWSTFAVPSRKRRNGDGRMAYLAELVKHKESARIVAEMYFAACPYMKDHSRLGRSLERKISGPVAVGAFEFSERQLAELLMKAIERDFSKAQTISLDGWILSETEVFLCSFVSIRR